MLKLKANPTFKAKVPIPVPGGDAVEVEMEFKHRTREELKDFQKRLAGTPEIPGLTDQEAVLEVVVSWELDDRFDKKSVALLLENYHGASYVITKTYLFELSQVRAKN